MAAANVLNRPLVCTITHKLGPGIVSALKRSTVVVEIAYLVDIFGYNLKELNLGLQGENSSFFRHNWQNIGINENIATLEEFSKEECLTVQQHMISSPDIWIYFMKRSWVIFQMKRNILRGYEILLKWIAQNFLFLLKMSQRWLNFCLIDLL